MPTEFQSYEVPQRSSVAVQILTIIFYSGFAISVSIVAMAMFGIFGIALAVFFAWQWARIPNLGGKIEVKEAVEQVRPLVTGAPLSESGNKSFDAYKQALMDRLEQEQTSFDQFLERLRTSKDRAEFDQFMDQRAMKSRTQTIEDETVTKNTNAQAAGTPLPA
ncbi:MAG: DUF2852 domain-containing protein [Pseudomonadota bacterium]